MTYVAPSTVVAGQTYGAAAHNVIVNDVIDHESRLGAAETLIAPLNSAWTSYTPTISQVGNVTKSVTYARYLKIGRLALVQVRLDVIAGTAGTAGTFVSVSLPSAVTPVGAGASGPNFGFGWIYDASTSTPYTLSARAEAGGVVAFMSDATGASYWGSTPSIGLTTSDQIHFTYICETTS